MEEMLAELRKIASQIYHPFLRKLLEAFFADENFVKKFKLAPAAKAVHHVYLGGLLEHTLSVVQLILLIGPRYKGINQELLVTGGSSMTSEKSPSSPSTDRSITRTRAVSWVISP
jgi:3'-5' exoribonuclease